MIDVDTCVRVASCGRGSCESIKVATTKITSISATQNAWCNGKNLIYNNLVSIQPWPPLITRVYPVLFHTGTTTPSCWPYRAFRSIRVPVIKSFRVEIKFSLDFFFSRFLLFLHHNFSFRWFSVRPTHNWSDCGAFELAKRINLIQLNGQLLREHRMQFVDK